MGLLNGIKSALKDILENTASVEKAGEVSQKEPALDSSELLRAGFDIDQIANDRGRLLLLGSNQEKVIRDVLSMNRYLRAAHDLCDSLPASRFSDSKLLFSPSALQDNTQELTYLTVMPDTKAGKRPKYPFELFAFNSQQLFGRLYYFSNGEVGKAEIVVWRKKTSFVVNLAFVDGHFIVNAIYKTEEPDFKKQKIYSYK